jgi:hypothetical protein
MIPKGTSHTSVPNSTYEVPKIIYNPTRKILVPFRTTKVCSSNWDLGKYSFLHIVYIQLQWSSGQSPQL